MGEIMNNRRGLIICLCLFLMTAVVQRVCAEKSVKGSDRTIVVSAEGLADPDADIYKRDKGLLIDDLRRDARRMVVEKAVGTFVDSSSLVENYTLIEDKVYTHSSGFIKRIIKESRPWLGKDGFMHLLLKAEVSLSGIKEALDSMPQAQRLHLIKEHGNPTISVMILVRDADRASSLPPLQSQVAENVLKEQFKQFGYRVWSEDYSRRLKGDLADKVRRQADFTVMGEAKFKPLKVRLQASGLVLSRYVLTSWTVKCINNHTGEEIFFTNAVPRRKSWTDEDAALQDIGRMIGQEFNKGFFEVHMMQPSMILELEVVGLPDYDTGLLLKKEFIGLRPILNVDFRNFEQGGLSLFEVEFAGERSNFSQILNNTIIVPINKKLGKEIFRLVSSHGNVVRLQCVGGTDPDDLKSGLESMPPASLSQASSQRVKELVSNPDIMKKVMKMNPMIEGHASGKAGSNGILQDF